MERSKAKYPIVLFLFVGDRFSLDLQGAEQTEKKAVKMGHRTAGECDGAVKNLQHLKPRGC